MTPHMLGDDSTYSIHPIREAAWPLDWEETEADRPSPVWKNIQFFLREYLVSNLVLVFLITALMVRTWAHKTWDQRHHSLWRLNTALKRTFDIGAAIIGLILASPILLLLSIMIKLDSPGPVFFRQLRVGVNRRKDDRRRTRARFPADSRKRDRRRRDVYGRPFEILKFRSMVQDAEKRCGPVWATTNDPRITRLGAFMRKTRLDEIPQLINVLKNEMSLVGPRPERPYFVGKLSQEVPGFLDRLRVAPGITGLAQVRNGYDSSIDDVHRKIHYDLSYIRGWNLVKDIKILYSTILVVLSGRGAC